MEVKDKIITEAKFNDFSPTKYDYKHFDVTFEDGSYQSFHYHKDNPMPKSKEMIGLTWEELCNLCRKMFYDEIEDYIKGCD